MQRTFFLFLFLWKFMGFSQHNSMHINAKLNTITNEISINQKIVFYNRSNENLKEIYLNNWANAYSSSKTKLAKRFLSSYNKRFFLSKNKDKGFSKVLSIFNNENIPFVYKNEDFDLIKVILLKNLKPNDSIVLNLSYLVKIPSNEFTNYGVLKTNYNLRYWYISPAVFDGEWKVNNNLNMDDLIIEPTNYNITFTIPKSYYLHSDLILHSQEITATNKTIQLRGENRKDIEIIITKINNFKAIVLDSFTLKTNFNTLKLSAEIVKSITERQHRFIVDYLGEYPHKSILISKNRYQKNPVYGLTQLPEILNPFSETFEYDIKTFKLLTQKFIEQTIVSDRRKYAWITDGIETYLMLLYIKKYYPEIKTMGAVAKIWGVKTYQFSKLDYHAKYSFVHQFAMQKNLDQALSTRADSLSNFNRKIVNKYKAGLGLLYLNDFIGDTAVKETLQELYVLKKATPSVFKKIVVSKTSKNLNWFFKDYIKTNKKLDYSIKSIKKHQDSLTIIVKNNRFFSAPIALYGLKDKTIKYKKWVHFKGKKDSITISNKGFDQITLNYESITPEINQNNNWKNLKPHLFNKPIQVRYLKDINNPFYNQIFYNLEYNYNFYDGIIVGGSLSNKTLVRKNWHYKIKPTYGFKSKKVNGNISLLYTKYFESSRFNKLRIGIGAGKSEFAKNLTYQRITPFVSLDLKRKSLRKSGGANFLFRMVDINKDVAPDVLRKEADSYTVFNLRHANFKPTILKELYYNVDFQYAKKFTKLASEFQYRKLTKSNHQIDVRLFGGLFLNNNTNSDFFNFSLNRPSDYLFDYSYFGRSEDHGFLSQQIIIGEGGFKSNFNENNANQWLVTSNASFGIWRWIEVYGDVGFFKNKNIKTQFKYDTGIRFNFVNRFFEVYFPLQSSNGFEPQLNRYNEKIRFVATLNLGKIYNFVRRGFY